MPPAPAVLFDVDGTLVDSTYLHTLAWWRALQDAGELRPMAAVHRLIGMGSDHLLSELIGRSDPALSDAHSRHYQRLKGELTALPGARELLRAVRERGGTVVLATSAKERDVEDLLRVLDAGDDIAAVVHAADVEQAKPSGDIFRTALERAGVSPERALAVGDTPWDVRAAAEAGVRCVAVLTGGHSRHDLTTEGAVAVYDSAAEVLAGLDDGPIGRLLGR